MPLIGSPGSGRDERKARLVKAQPATTTRAFPAKAAACVTKRVNGMWQNRAGVCSICCGPSPVRYHPNSPLFFSLSCYTASLTDDAPIQIFLSWVPGLRLCPCRPRRESTLAIWAFASRWPTHVMPLLSSTSWLPNVVSNRLLRPWCLLDGKRAVCRAAKQRSSVSETKQAMRPVSDKLGPLKELPSDDMQTDGGAARLTTALSRLGGQIDIGCEI